LSKPVQWVLNYEIEQQKEKKKKKSNYLEIHEACEENALDIKIVFHLSVPVFFATML
jgi:hypothetical protein